MPADNRGPRIFRKVVCSLILLLHLPAACSDGEGLGYAKTGLAERLRDSRNEAALALEKYSRKELPGRLGQQLGPDIREEKISGEEVTWILDLIGSGDEPDWFGQTQVTIRGCFKLHSPGGTKLITEQYNCGPTPSPGYPDSNLPEYKNTLKDCELDVCKPLASPTPSAKLP